MLYYIQIDFIKSDFRTRLEILRKTNERNIEHEKRELELENMKKDTEKEKEEYEKAKKEAEERLKQMDNEMKMLMTKLSQPQVIHVRESRGCSIM